MSKEITFGLIGIFIGGLVMSIVLINYPMLNSTIAESSSKSSAVMDHDSMGHDMNNMSMSDMNHQLEGLTGDQFDKAFIEMMIPHHQGAIDMAELALKNAQHQEIKDLSKSIIEAQQSEIEMMQQWQLNWGY